MCRFMPDVIFAVCRVLYLMLFCAVCPFVLFPLYACVVLGPVPFCACTILILCHFVMCNFELVPFCYVPYCICIIFSQEQYGT
jgi:hypothetical protein